MTRPGLFTYLCGNPLSVVGSLGLLGWVGLQAYQGSLNYIALILAGLLAARCWRCASQLQAYGRWQKEWNAMNGKSAGGGWFASAPWLRWPVAIAIWIAISFGAIVNLTGTEQSLAVLWFWVGNTAFAGYLLFRFLRRRPKRQQAAKWTDVDALVAKPMVSADARQVVSVLPEYCRQLFT